MSTEKVLVLGTAGLEEKNINLGNAAVKISVALTSNQTTVNVPGGYTLGGLLVFLNGTYLSPSEYTATDLTTVKLHVGSPSATSVMDIIVLDGGLTLAQRGDLLSSLVHIETNLSSNTVLTNAAYEKQFVCSGSGNYSVTLPSASLNTGRSIGFRMSPTLLGVVTILPQGSDTIDGAPERVFWKHEYCVFQSTGIGWVKIAGKMIPMRAEMYPISAITINHGVNTKLPLEAVVSDTSGIMTDPTVNKRIVIPRSGNWRVQGIVYYQPGTDVMSVNQCRLLVNGVLAPLGVNVITTDTPAAKAAFNQHTAVLNLNRGDYVELFGLQTSVGAVARSVYVNNTAFSYLSVVEQVHY